MNYISRVATATAWIRRHGSELLILVI